MKPHFNRAVIYGVGLLGGSLGIALRRNKMAREVVGLGRSEERLRVAREMGAVGEIATEPGKALAGADAIFICLPPRLIREEFANIAPHVAPGAFVTDVGSVKRAIIEAGERDLPTGALFIGSHPMAGSEKSGVESAMADLYADAACVVTPTERTPPEALSTAVSFWRELGSRVIVASPERHDELLASISHLPHLAASSLVETLFGGGDATHMFRAIAGNGFRDTTRIAAGDAGLWEEIFSENSAPLLQSLDRMIENLRTWRELLSRDEARAQIRERLAKAAAHRRDLGDSGKRNDD